ncbi:hypothetical protein [Amycolatopsis anabasis]|uniref:hypothetical protein n=1 Tax=Amycolatopsis anabasis TaxID=1840409 RepID=UPI00131D1785|nr:hypothetical protein [Amycolatopsis anabasis]
MLRSLVDQRQQLDAALRHRSTPFLFPWMRAGRPLTSAALQGRLRKLGIPSTRTARNGAWLALVGSVHWKMLADLLGVADGTASTWHKENGCDASYVATRLRQQHQPTGPDLTVCRHSSPTAQPAVPMITPGAAVVLPRRSVGYQRRVSIFNSPVVTVRMWSLASRSCG